SDRGFVLFFYSGGFTPCYMLTALRALFQRKKILSPENGGIRGIFWLCHAGNNVVFWEINNVTV
ncbi:MAG: hypothetical protein AAB258_03710, partial [Planctomycetota bacterium]